MSQNAPRCAWSPSDKPTAHTRRAGARTGGQLIVSHALFEDVVLDSVRDECVVVEPYELRFGGRTGGAAMIKAFEGSLRRGRNSRALGAQSLLTGSGQIDGEQQGRQ